MRIRLLVLCLFLALVRCASAESAPHWLEVRTDHFIVVTDGSDHQARHIADQFERMRALFRTILPQNHSDASSPIIVLALKDKKGFNALEPAAYLAKGQLQLAGLFLRTPGSNYILLSLDSEQEHPFATVYHEYTHFVMRKAEWMPLWLGEGLAEFYQNTDIDGKDVRLGQPSPDDIYYLRQHKLLPLATLLTVDHSSPYYHDEQKGSVFYAESWALVHYIEVNDAKQKTSRLRDYALALSQHQDPVTAAQQVFGDLTKLQRALDDYVSQGSFSFFKTTSTFTLDENTLHVLPLSADAANAVRANVLAYDDRQTEARTLAEAVLSNDPSDALAAETLGDICTLQNDHACAKRWFTQAAQLKDASAFTLFQYALLSLQDDDRSHDDAIEAALHRSIQLDPSFAPAYDALAHFYASRHEKLSEAHIANVQAIQLEPEDLSYRINAASVLMEGRDTGGALSVLKAARSIFKSPSDAAILNQRIQQIEQFQAVMQQAAPANGSSADGSAHTITLNPEHAAEPDAPPYPPDSAAGPHHTASGVLHAVNCAYPTIFTLQLVQPPKTLSLYSNNYMKIPFTTANFVPEHDIDVCHTLDGMKARIEYADVSDPRVTGQIVSIQLSK